MLVRLAPFLFVLLCRSSFIAEGRLQHASPLLFVAVRLTSYAAVLVTVMLIRHMLARGAACKGDFYLVPGTALLARAQLGHAA